MSDDTALDPPRRSITLMDVPSAPELHTPPQQVPILPPGILLPARSRQSSTSTSTLSSSASHSGSASTSTISTNSPPHKRAATLPLPSTCSVKFAPLPSIEPRKRSPAAGSLGVSSRAAMLRQRIAQQQHMQQYGQVHSPYAYDDDDGGFSTYPYNMIPRGTRGPSRGMDEEDEALAALGSIINDAAKSLWRKISRKKKKSKKEGGEGEAAGAKGASQDERTTKESPPAAPSPPPSDKPTESSAVIPPKRNSSLRRKELQLENMKAVPYSVPEEDEEDPKADDESSDRDVPETPKNTAAALPAVTAKPDAAPDSDSKVSELTNAVEVHVVETVG